MPMKAVPIKKKEEVDGRERRGEALVQPLPLPGDDGARDEGGVGDGATDELVMLLMPVSTMDAAKVLAKRAGLGTYTELINYALKHLEETMDARGVPK